MNKLIKAVVRRLPYVRRLHKQVKEQGVYPPGHFYSPIPNRDEICAHMNSLVFNEIELPDVQLNKEHQFSLLQEYNRYYNELPFSEGQKDGCRYYYDNTYFSYSDAIFLYSFLRKHKPKRIVEIGSGFSSAVMLDTAQGFFPFWPEMSFIDPNLDRLNSLLTLRDKSLVKIIGKKVQEVSLDAFQTLESGDLLFIDSSHVVKYGNDLQFILFELLPFLPHGVYVHFHDVFFPFEYPDEWVREGRYWNESYFLRAFLSYNKEWNIEFFNAYAAIVFSEYINKNMPLCVKNTGGSLYIRKQINGLESS